MKPANGHAVEILESTALTVLPPESLSVTRAPDVVLREAREAAAALKDVIDSKPKKVMFNGEVYLENEDWGTIGRFYGICPKIRLTRFIEFGVRGEEGYVGGFEAICDAINVNTGMVVSSAEAMCLNDERNWKSKPLFQLRSMAQTRASSRVLRQVLGWVVVLAGYKATPAEEMTESQPAIMTAICSECGTDIYEDGKFIAASKIKFNKTLCKICQKHAKPVAPNVQEAIKATGAIQGVPLVWDGKAK